MAPYPFSYRFTIEVMECKPGVYPPRESFSNQRLGFFCLWDDQFTFVSVTSFWRRQLRLGIPWPTGPEDPRTLHRIPYAELARVTSERRGTKFGLHTRGGQSHYFGTEFLDYDYDFGFGRAASEITRALHRAGYTVTYFTKDLLTVLDDATKGSLRPARIEGAERERLARLAEQNSTRRAGRGRTRGYVPRHGGEAMDLDEAPQELTPG